MASAITPNSVSEAGILFIKTMEGGFQAKPYLDEGSSGNRTVGYGHLIRPGEEFPTSGIDEKRAEEIFCDDLQQVVSFLNSKVSSLNLEWISQNQYDALASWIFNAGTGEAVNGSDVWKALSASPPDWSWAIKTLNMWIHAGKKGEKSWHVVPGLKRRRLDETILFLEHFPRELARQILQDAGISVPG